MTERARRLLHPVLETAGGTLLERAGLTDRDCLGVVFQGAAFLAHLEHGGWRLAGGWERARVRDGHLAVSEIRPGRSPELVQVSLRKLLRILFRARGPISGPGPGRQAAARLEAAWRQTLAPLAADRAVEEIFEAAPFLWQEPFARIRTALVGEHCDGDGGHLWLAGPTAARRRFLARGGDRDGVAALLAGPEALDLWEGFEPRADPLDLVRRGRLRRAVVAWRRNPPREWQEIQICADTLFTLGRYSQSLAVLEGQRRIDARLMRMRCQIDLGELNAAHATLHKLASKKLSPEQTVELCEIAIRLLAAQGKKQKVFSWIKRALAAPAGGETRLRAFLVAAGGAWDVEDAELLEEYLERAREALNHPELAAIWHHMRGLRSMLAADGPGTVEHLSAALRHDRRRLPRAQAGRLWTDLAVGRVLADDLAGAERACRHALRLLGACEGPARTTLALYNLAEVKLRRGRVRGVETILEQSTAQNRRSGNLRGLAHDLELWVRLELVQGRAAAALARCAEAFELEDTDLRGRREVFEVLAARAQGWLGRRELAAARLERASDEAVRELEPEERPAVWALAGLDTRALEEASGTRWSTFWRELLAATVPRSDTWRVLDSLEPYRAARLVFDCELIRPGVVPPRAIRRAIASFRRCGADALEERLEGRSLSPWRALESYLERDPDRGADVESITALLAGAGYADAELRFVAEDREEVLKAGAGGGEELAAVAGDGRMVLRAPSVDRVLPALFALIRRDFQPPRRRRPIRAHDGIVGDSPGLHRALERLERLAAGDLPILILGESGTGKELMAQQAHRASRRADGPMVALNCAALAENLIESDLFGHVKGSFTGAVRDRAGVFESARAGTVFLDEIGDLPLPAQGKLLRVLQESEIRRVGESFARKVDVRVVAATHRDLEHMVRQGEFRQDLFFRLKGATVVLPPLRERGRDVLLLAEHFLRRMRPAATPSLSTEARSELLDYHWPGNVRELQNVLEVAAAMASGAEIGTRHLDLKPRSEIPAGDYHQQVKRFRKDLIAKALSESGGKRIAAARRLGLSRQALSYLIKQLGVS